jgi:hypothetical protein
MKRYSLVAFLGLTVMLLALSPQLRADGCDHFNYEHGNTIAATSTSHNDMDATHSDTWRDNDDHDRHADGGAGNGWCMGKGSSSSSSPSASDSMHASTPEPSSLLLLLSGLLPWQGA